MDKFKEWFVSQYFYSNLRFVHGDALFDKDGDFFRILAVQIAWEVWQSRQTEIEKLNDNHLAYIDKVIAMESDYLEKIEEKDKRIESALFELESLHNKKWAEWKERADMHSQGEANAYEHAMQILEKVLRGNNANS